MRFDTFHYTTKDLVFNIKVDSIDTKLLDDVLPFSCCIFCTFSFFPKFWSSLHIIPLNSFCILVSQTWKSDFETKPPLFAFTAWLLKYTHRKKYSFPLEMPHMTTLKMPRMKTLTMPQMTTLKKPQMTTLKMSHMKTLKMLQMKTCFITRHKASPLLQQRRDHFVQWTYLFLNTWISKSCNPLETSDSNL